VKVRLALATALAGGLLVSMSGAQAGPPVMDGKKVKVLNKSAVGPATTQHLAAFDEVTCEDPTKCLTLPFVYKPAKGVKGDLMFTATWTNPAADFDLYVIEVDPKKKTETMIAQCATAPFTKERVFISAKDLRPGRIYRMVVGFYLPLGDTVKTSVQIGVPNTIPTTVPAAVDAENATNCAL
jgi:hypothetical protein